MKQPPDEQVIAGTVAANAVLYGSMLLYGGNISAEQLDKKIEEYIRCMGCTPALKGYKPPFTDRVYNHTICLSVNNTAVHGVPQGYEINAAEDLVTIDLVVEHKGWYADTARTFTLSKNPEKTAIVAKIQKLHNAALQIISPNSSISEYSLFCEKIAQEVCDVSIIKEFCGHGIGKSIHENPQVPCTSNFSNDKFEVGRSYAIEPVIAAKSKYKIRDGADGWSVNADCLTAHMEDTIFIAEGGIINLTR
jgi:methionyl aminopeptidase